MIHEPLCAKEDTSTSQIWGLHIVFTTHIRAKQSLDTWENYLK